MRILFFRYDHVEIVGRLLSAVLLIFKHLVWVFNLALALLLCRLGHADIHSGLLTYPILYAIWIFARSDDIEDILGLLDVLLMELDDILLICLAIGVVFHGGKLVILAILIW